MCEGVFKFLCVSIDWHTIRAGVVCVLFTTRAPGFGTGTGIEEFQGVKENQTGQCQGA